MELCDQSLQVFEQVNRRLNEEETLQVISQLTAGVAYLHDNGIVHQ